MCSWLWLVDTVNPALGHLEPNEEYYSPMKQNVNPAETHFAGKVSLPF